MVRVLSPILLLLLCSPALEAQSLATADSVKIRQEILALSHTINAAIQRRDRAALEQVYAPEFIAIHAYGYVDARQDHIDQLLLRDSTDLLPLPNFSLPSALHIYGDVVVHHFPGRTAGGTPALSTRIYAKRAGRWQIVRIHSTEMQPERVAVSVDRALLERYAGRYDRGNGQFVVIEREGDALFRILPGLPKVRLIPVTSAQFFDRIGAEWRFERIPTGSDLRLIYRFRDRSWSAEKVR